MKLGKKFFFYILCCFVGLSSYANSWCDAGHMIVAEIAYRNLNTQAKDQLAKLNAFIAPTYPQFATLYSSVTYPDKARELSSCWTWNVWHYTEIPYDPQAILSVEQKVAIANRNLHSDVVYGIKEAANCLDVKPPISVHLWYMHVYLMHFVADIHQPLHCCSYYGTEKPTGDRGGNLFKIKDVPQTTLHNFWDFALGSLPAVGDPNSTQSQDFVKSKATEITVKYPACSFPHLDEMNPEIWARESAELASQVSYKLIENQVPDKAYVEEGVKVAEQRMALAGYRLAQLLNKVFSSPQ